MGAKDLAEKNLLQYKDVFSDIVNVNLFGGRCYVSAEELSREPGELITKAVSDDKLRQLQMDVPMKCKKHNRSFFYVWKIRVTKTTLCRCAIWDTNTPNIWSRSRKRKKVIEKPAIIQTR